LINRRGFELQQLCQGGGSGVKHSRAHRHLGGLQIEMASGVAAPEDDDEQLV